ncbi:hypothetical protein EZ428_12830 [Pedobacter frigiditerrae]|uniref:Uncharacterized protein n=1 Tax=Pedobacter frigiditerrae TaxID=2530452 RepID=A0A4R0MT14_9SPHI|nr:DUF6544 family protein [Pedobacter frigiditerrae]TCC90165.1 hypothetical protein EZ428_12830 [Pedobacter frigiditerrae]
MGNLKHYFSTELRRARALVKKIYTGKRAVSDLPTALQHFVLQSGCLSLGNIHQVKIEWKNARLKLSKKGSWKSITCVQHNFLPDPIRLVYMSTKVFGLIGIEALDSFRHGNGNMMVKAAGLFKLVDAKGYQMDKAELVTLLAETMIIPDYALQTYTQWEEIDLYTVRGTINYHGLKAVGLFYFNENFQVIKFETNDRYYTQSNGNFLETKWTAECKTYIKHNDITFPSAFSATWNFPQGDLTYFKGEINNIIFSN